MILGLQDLCIMDKSSPHLLVVHVLLLAAVPGVALLLQQRDPAQEEECGGREH